MILLSVIVGLVFGLSAGEHEIRGRIFNGKEAVDQFKYMAVIISEREIDFTLATTQFICGGSIISPNWDLTAAHCLDDISYMHVVLGVRMAGDSKVVYKLQRYSIVIHPDFDNERKLNDIALIQIPTTRVCDRINFAQLPFKSIGQQVLTDKIGITMGCGQTGDNSCIADRLLWTETGIMSNEQCQQYSRYPTHKQLCGDTRKPYGSPCPGDSGGPLILKDTNVLIGLISYGNSISCEAGKPVFFTRITSYLPWISRLTGITS